MWVSRIYVEADGQPCEWETQYTAKALIIFGFAVYLWDYEGFF